MDPLLICSHQWSKQTNRLVHALSAPSHLPFISSADVCGFIKLLLFKFCSVYKKQIWWQSHCVHPRTQIHSKVDCHPWHRTVHCLQNHFHFLSHTHASIKHEEVKVFFGAHWMGFFWYKLFWCLLDIFLVMTVNSYHCKPHWWLIREEKYI